MDWANDQLQVQRPLSHGGFWSVIANRFSVGDWIDRFETRVLAGMVALSGQARVAVVSG
jgi:hypothetical protein